MTSDYLDDLLLALGGQLEVQVVVQQLPYACADATKVVWLLVTPSCKQLLK